MTAVLHRQDLLTYGLHSGDTTKKGMLIKVENDLFRVLDLQHFTPGNKRGFVRAKMRNIRTGTLADNKFRAEEDVERATLDEREMQYLYQRRRLFHFMDTERYEQIHIDAEVLGDNANYIVPEMTILVEFYDEEPVGIELPVTVDLKVDGHGARHQRRDGERAGEAGDARNGPRRAGAAVRQHRRHHPRQHGDRRIPEQAMSACGSPSRQKIRMDVVRTARPGWIEVVTGSMFSGKSEELIRRLRRAQIARQKVQIFKPRIDNRYGELHIVSHSQMRIEVGERRLGARAAGHGSSRHRGRRHRRGAVLRSRAAGGLQHAGRPGPACDRCRARPGLPGQAVRADAALMAIAEYVTKTQAMCMVCGNPASHTQRLVASSDRVLLGAQGTYEARCRQCFDPT